MQEVYSGSGSYGISKREIEKMKRNMKKVPIIQKKSESYHKNQGKQAEEFIEGELEEISNDNLTVIKDQDIKENNGFVYKILNRLKNLLAKSKNGY